MELITRLGVGEETLSNHMGDTDNSRAVNKTQVGLGNVQNTSLPSLASVLTIIVYMVGSILTIMAVLELTGRIGLAIVLQIIYTLVFLLALTYSDRIYQLIHRSSD